MTAIGLIYSVDNKSEQNSFVQMGGEGGGVQRTEIRNLPSNNKRQWFSVAANLAHSYTIRFPLSIKGKQASAADSVSRSAWYESIPVGSDSPAAAVGARDSCCCWSSIKATIVRVALKALSMMSC